MKVLAFARKGDQTRREEFSSVEDAQTWADALRRNHWVVTVVTG